MNLSQVATNAASAAPTSTVNNPFAELSSGEFIKIMLTELTNQDPLEPNESQAILEQLSSLRNIEGQLQLEQKLETLVLGQSVAQAGGMIGKIVSGLDANNDEIEGLVTAVRITDGTAQLELDSGQKLPIANVTTISEHI